VLFREDTVELVASAVDEEVDVSLVVEPFIGSPLLLRATTSLKFCATS
jgi:hypothetical protein